MSIETAGSLAGLPERLRQRLSIRNEAPLFQSLEWLQCLIENAGFTEAGVRVFFDSSGGWMLPMYRQGRGPLESLSNYYSPEFAILGDSARVDRGALVETVMAASGGAGRVELRHLRPNCAGGQVLIDGFRESRFSVEVRPQYANWYCPVAWSSFDEFMQSRPSKLQNTVRRARSRLKKHHRVAFVLTAAPDEGLEPAIAAYTQIYQKSWKPRENHPAFVPALIRLAAAHGRLRLGTLTIDDIPAAAQLWFFDRDVAHIYKLAHDPQFQPFSVGSILTAEMFRHAIDVDRACEIDFGVGEEPYKRDWVTQRRDLLQLEAIDSRKMKGWIALTRRRAGRLVRRLTRAVGAPVAS